MRPTRELGRATLERSSIWSCTGWGLPSFPGRPRNWCALTAPFHPYRPDLLWGEAGSGGLLSVALSFTPRYGAPCPVVFGLSSGNGVPSDRLVYSGRSPHIGYLCHAVFFRIYPSTEFYYRRGTISSCQNAAARCTSEGGYSYDSPCKSNFVQAPRLYRLGTFS